MKIRPVLVAGVLATSLLMSCSSTDSSGTGASAEKVNGVIPITGGSEVHAGNGSGTVEVEREDNDTGPVMIRVTSTGGPLSHFGVTGNEDEAPVVDSAGKVDGFAVIASLSTTELAVSSVEDWTIQFVPLEAAKKFSGGELTGAGPTVLANSMADGEIKMTFEPAEGDDLAASSTIRFAQVGVDDAPEAVRIRMGEGVTFSAPVVAGGYLVISGDGDWTIVEAP